MDTDSVIWIAGGVVLALVIIGVLAAVMNKKKRAQRAAHAAELRRDAHTRAPELQDADLQAREAQLEADRARLEAERAAARAQEVEQARAAEHASYEDRLREADQLDPRVNTRSSDYRPDTRYPATPADPVDPADPAAPPPPPPPGEPTHRAGGPTP